MPRGGKFFFLAQEVKVMSFGRPSKKDTESGRVVGWMALGRDGGFKVIRNGAEVERTPQLRSCTKNYLSDAARRRSRCGSVRGRPVLSSHFSPGLAPQVGQRTDSACFSLTFISHIVRRLPDSKLVNSDQSIAKPSVQCHVLLGLILFDLGFVLSQVARSDCRKRQANCESGVSANDDC